MDERGTGSLAERVDRLERSKSCGPVPDVQRATRHLTRAQSLKGMRGSCVTFPALPEPATVTASERTVRERLRGLRMPFEMKTSRRGEWWLNKIRTGLLLFGVAFSFLLTVKRGGVTPAMRVGFGLLCASKQPLSRLSAPWEG